MSRHFPLSILLPLQLFSSSSRAVCKGASALCLQLEESTSLHSVQLQLLCINLQINQWLGLYFSSNTPSEKLCITVLPTPFLHSTHTSAKITGSVLVPPHTSAQELFINSAGRNAISCNRENKWRPDEGFVENLLTISMKGLCFPAAGHCD